MTRNRNEKIQTVDLDGNVPIGWIFYDSGLKNKFTVKNLATRHAGLTCNCFDWKKKHKCKHTRQVVKLCKQTPEFQVNLHFADKKISAEGFLTGVGNVFVYARSLSGILKAIQKKTGLFLEQIHLSFHPDW